MKSVRIKHALGKTAGLKQREAQKDRIPDGSSLRLSVAADAGFNGKSIHQPVILFHSYVTSLVRGVGPLKLSIRQSNGEKTEAYSFKHEPLQAVFLQAAEEKQGSFLQRIQSVGQAYKRRQ